MHPSTAKNLVLFQIIGVTNTALTFITNILLIFVILRFSRRSLGSYRYLMILFAVFDMLYSASHALSNPIMFTHRHAFVVFASGPYTGQLVSLGYCAFFFALSLSLLAGHFLYRYLLICKNEWMFLFDDVRYRPILILLWLSQGTVWALCVKLGMSDFEVTKNYTRDAVLDEFNVDVDQAGMVAPLFFTDAPDGSKRFFWPTWTIFFCSFRIHDKLKSCTMSEKSRRLQIELFKALIVQAVIPSIFEYTPCLVAMGTAMLGIPLGRYANWCPTLLTFYTWLDPICIMLCVKDYRRAFRRCFRADSRPGSRSTAENSYASRNLKTRIEPSIVKLELSDVQV
ncbi:unnamed protein product, partial [Mesorhabditis spiculigera]